MGLVAHLDDRLQRAWSNMRELAQYAPKVAADLTIKQVVTTKELPEASSLEEAMWHRKR